MRTNFVWILTLLLAVAATAVQAQTRVIQGRVTDRLSGSPVVGAEVLVQGTTIRTTVAEDGSFTVAAPAGDVTLVVRRIGYRRAEAVVPGNQSSVTVQLESDALQLEEVVVTGQATGIARRNLPNAVSTVSAEELERTPSASVEQQINGKVAGANIQKNSGAPGGGLQIELRGVTSINATAQPLWVVDGVIMSDAAIPSNTNAVTAASGGSNPALTQDNQVNRIVDLNPNDIETIEVLKGPSAAAIYGQQASSGVIIVTTKQGRQGRPQLRLSQRFGFFDLANKLGFRPRDFASAAEVDDAFGLPAGTADAYGFQPGVSYDLEEMLAGRHPLSFETSGSVSGGGESTRYFVSGLAKNDGGVMANTGFEKQSLRVNIEQDISDRVLLQVGSNFMHTLARRGLSNNDNAGVSPYMVFPFTPNIFDLSEQPDGTFPDNPFERSNPLQTLANMSNDEDVWRLVGSARLEVEAIQGASHSLRLIGSGGVDRFHQKNELLFPPELQFEDDDGLPGTSLLSNSDAENINVSGNAVYTYTPSTSVTATTSAGVQYFVSDLNTARITSRNTVPGQTNVDQATFVQVRELRQRTELLGLFLQEEVLLNDRLLLTAGIRADQASTNTDDGKLFAFPKLAASYRVPVAGGWLEEVKFRAAYGESGNQPLYGAKFTPLTATVNIGGLPGYQIQGTVVTTGLEPERQREFEGGVDATLFGGRASLEATAYRRTTDNMIHFRQLAPSSGFAQEVFNGGSWRVIGAELAAGIVPAQAADFTWVFRSTFSLNRSTVTELPVPSYLPPNAGFGTGLGSFRIEEGQSATQIVGNVPDGSGGTVIAKVGDSNPDFRMSFLNDLTWKGFNLFFLWDWQQGSQIVNLTKLLSDAGGNTADWDEIDPESGDPIGLHRITTFGTDIRVFIEDATFLKLRELSLSYDLPAGAVQGLWGAVRSARLTASARDLLTFTSYTGMDPEVSNFGNQGIGRNIDVAPFPRTRSFWFGIDLGF
jgi:TonB-linked SusC/RagA family outer membrane protein